MQNGETPPTNNTEINPTTGSENPWQRMAEEAPPFGGGEKQYSNTSETGKNTNESDDYYTFEGVEYRNIDKIDISTDQGKFEWIDSLVGNANARLEDEQDNIIREEGLYGMDKKEQEEYLEYNDAYQDNKRSLDLARRQSKILENLDIDGDGGVLGALERRRNSFAEVMNNPKASKEAQEAAFQNWDAAANLYLILSGEMVRRDPEYFGQEEMSATLKSEVAQAEQRVERTMVDGYFGEDGFLHKAPNGEKMPSAATEDAEIDLKYAKQDAETFDLLMNDYQAANDYAAPRAIKKEDFAPTIDRFIDDHTTQIDRLRAESKTLTKGTPEYAENEAKRRKLAGERSSARRLVARYFNVPKPESASSSTSESDADDGMNMEQVPAGKTKEQIEAENTKKRQEEEAYQKRVNEYWEQKRQTEQGQREENERQQQAREEAEAEKRQQEKSPTSYHFEGGLVDGEATITVGQEIPDDWFESRTSGDRTSSGFGVDIVRPPRIEGYLSQALNIEFGKLSEAERQRYNYSALSGAIMEEAKRTKRIPDIANIMSHQLAIDKQREKVEQSFGQGTSQQTEEELEDEMSM